MNTPAVTPPPAPPPPPPPTSGPSSDTIPYFVADPDNNPSTRTGNLKNRGQPEDNFKYDRNPNFDERLVVPNFYQGIKLFEKLRC